MTGALREVYRRLTGMIARAVVSGVTDTLAAQGLQIRIYSGEVQEDVERFGEFGLASVPPVGTEAIVIRIGGSPDHPVVIATESRAHRPTGGEPGDVTVYDAHGNAVRLRAGGVEVVSAGYIRLGAGATQAAVLGDALLLAYNAHTHVFTPGGPSPTGPPIPLLVPADLSTTVKVGT